MGPTGYECFVGTAYHSQLPLILVKLFSSIAGGAQHLKEQATSGLSEVRGASLEAHVSAPGFPSPAVSMAAELFT